MRAREWLRIGTLPGRHVQPVDDYLIKQSELVYLGPWAYERAYEAALKYPFDPARYQGIELFYTGLTTVTLGALDGFMARGITTFPMFYDENRRCYIRVNRWRAMQQIGG